MIMPYNIIILKLMRLTDKAKHKARVLAFWEKHNIEATIDAFNVQERTLYLWKNQLKKGEGKLISLNEKSKKPTNIRRREWPQSIKGEIRRIREEHPNLWNGTLFLVTSQ